MTGIVSAQDAFLIRPECAKTDLSRPRETPCAQERLTSILGVWSIRAQMNGSARPRRLVCGIAVAQPRKLRTRCGSEPIRCDRHLLPSVLPLRAVSSVG